MFEIGQIVYYIEEEEGKERKLSATEYTQKHLRHGHIPGVSWAVFFSTPEEAWRNYLHRCNNNILFLNEEIGNKRELVAKWEQEKLKAEQALSENHQP